MLLLLLAGCTPQHLALGVTPPKAVNAGAVPTAAFVGPLDVVGLDAAAVCGATTSERTRARLLGEGRYGWRVLGLAGDRVRLPDGTVEPADGPHPALDALAARWAAADRAVASLCGTTSRTPVLFAPDAAAMHTPPLMLLSTLERAGALPSAVYLLVDDATPDAVLASPPLKAGRSAPNADGFATLALDGDASALLWSSGAPAQLGSPEALAQAIAPGTSLLLTSRRDAPWSDIVRAHDVFAPSGIVPSWTLNVDEVAPTYATPRFDGPAVLYWGDTVAVLPTTAHAMLLQVISTSSEPAAPPISPEAADAALRSAADARHATPAATTPEPFPGVAPAPADATPEPFPGVAPAPALTP